MKFYQNSLFKAIIASLIAIITYMSLRLSLYILISSTVIILAFFAIDDAITLPPDLTELLVKTGVAFAIVSFFGSLLGFIHEVL